MKAMPHGRGGSPAAPGRAPVYFSEGAGARVAVTEPGTFRVPDNGGT